MVQAAERIEGVSVDESAAQGTTALRPEAPLSGGYGEPVAWRVKDYADGWIIFQKESAAAAYRAETGALMEPLYDSSLLSRAQAAEAKLGEAMKVIVGLNATLDAYWNVGPDRPTNGTINKVCTAQQACAAFLSSLQQSEQADG